MPDNPQTSAETRDTLKAALALEKELRERIPDYAEKGGFNGYGEAKDGQYVCTTFAQAVLGRAGYDVSHKIASQININIDWNKELGKQKPSRKEVKTKLTELVEHKDPRTKGIVEALVSSGQGREIGVSQLQPGDFVQYWIVKKDGSSVGHVVQVSEVPSEGVIRAHGSHYSKRGVTTIKLNLKNKTKVYCVRPRFSRYYGEVQ